MSSDMDLTIVSHAREHLSAMMSTSCRNRYP